MQKTSSPLGNLHGMLPPPSQRPTGRATHRTRSEQKHPNEGIWDCLQQLTEGFKQNKLQGEKIKTKGYVPM